MSISGGETGTSELQMGWISCSLSQAGKFTICSQSLCAA
jgi:hypothetical protein